MSAADKAELSKPLTEQANGIVLMFSRYSDEVAQDYGWNSFFVPKSFINLNNSGGHTFTMSTSKFSSIATKYLYIKDNSIVGNDENILSGTNNGITYNNSAFVLRYIVGV